MDPKYQAYASIRNGLTGFTVSTDVLGVKEALVRSDPAATITGQTFVSNDMGVLTGQVINVLDGTVKHQYACAPGVYDVHAYGRDYKMPCDNAAASLSVGVKHTVVYQKPHVTYSPGDQNAAYATINGPAVDEWEFQHTVRGYTFNLTMDHDLGLRWDDSHQVEVTLYGWETYTIPTTNTTCKILDISGKPRALLQCTVQGADLTAQLAKFDPHSNLDQGDACIVDGQADVNITGQVNCYFFTVSVQQRLRQPTDIIDGQWEPDTADNYGNCSAPALLHTLPQELPTKVTCPGPVANHGYHCTGGVETSNTNSKVKIYIPVVGREQVYRGAVSVFKDESDTDNASPFRAIAADTSTEATGEDAVYASTLLASNGTAPAATAGMRFAIQFDADELGDNNADQNFKFESEYLSQCPQQTWSEDCPGGDVSITGADIKVKYGKRMVFFVRLAGDENPCQGKFDGQPAEFGGKDLTFSIKRGLLTDSVSTVQAHTYSLPLTCDKEGGSVVEPSALRVVVDGAEKADGEIVFPDVVLGDVLQFNDFHMGGRDPATHTGEVTISRVVQYPSDSSAAQDTLVFEDGTVTMAMDDTQDNHKVGFQVLPQVLPGDDATISCSYLLVELTAKVNVDTDNIITFRVQCPRVKQADPITDALKLDYSITSMTFGLQESSIQLPDDDDSASSVVAFAAPDAECDAVFGGDGPAAVCDLSGAIGAVKPFEKGASAFMTDLDGACGAIGGFADGVSEDGSTITLRGDVVRKYTKDHAAFGGAAQTFCGRTPYTLSVDRQQDQSTLISVAHPQDMDYDVEVIELKHEQCTFTEGNATEGTTYYQLYVQIEAKRKGVDVSDWSADLDILGVSPAIGSQLAVNDNQITYQGVCQSEAQTSQDFSFSMTTSIHGLDYTGMASVAVELQAPDVETVDKLAFSADDIVITCTRANGESAAFDAACVDGVAAADNVQIVIEVTEDEAAAFGHSYSVPTVGGNPADDLGFEYRALIGSKQLEQDIVSSDNQQVRLRALPFAGQSGITVEWTVTRIKASRRLRQVVSYTLGADGSVSKSISFAVAPAVRESDGAAAVGDEIVERIAETTDDNGTTTRTTTVVEERKAKPAPTQVEGSVHTTSTRTDDDKDEHTWIMVTGIVGIASAVGLIAVVAYLFCTCRTTYEDEKFTGGAFAVKQVPAFMGAPMRWQRDRFLNNI